MYSYLRQAWREQERSALKGRMIEWRSSEAAEVVDKPLRLDKAHALGYKAKKGFVVVRIRLLRGGRRREHMGVKGRKSRKQHRRKILKMSYQWVAEIRAAKKFPNLEVLNSYPIGEDGKHAFFEVIMVDPHKPEILSDRNVSWISRGSNRRRAERGLTSAARKSRGLRSRRPNMKVRPSQRAWGRRGK